MGLTSLIYFIYTSVNNLGHYLFSNHEANENREPDNNLNNDSLRVQLERSIYYLYTFLLYLI